MAARASITLALASALIACSGGERAEAPPPTHAEPAPTAEPSPPPTPAVPEGAGATAPSEPPALETEPALVAYRTALTALRRGDPSGYFGAFADPLECFHGRRDVPLARVRQSREPIVLGNAGEDNPWRARPLTLRVTSATPDEVELVDYGWSGRASTDPQTIFHAKRVVLRRQGERWLIAVETPVRDEACGPPLRDDPPPLWSAMRRAFQELVRECECDSEECPGLGGSIGCDPSTTIIEPRSVCTAAAPSERSACLGNARAEIEAFGLGVE